MTPRRSFWEHLRNGSWNIKWDLILFLISVRDSRYLWNCPTLTQNTLGPRGSWLRLRAMEALRLHLELFVKEMGREGGVMRWHSLMRYRHKSNVALSVTQREGLAYVRSLKHRKHPCTLVSSYSWYILSGVQLWGQVWNSRVKVTQTQRGMSRSGATKARRYSWTSWLRNLLNWIYMVYGLCFYKYALYKDVGESSRGTSNAIEGQGMCEAFFLLRSCTLCSLFVPCFEVRLINFRGREAKGRMRGGGRMRLSTPKRHHRNELKVWTKKNLRRGSNYAPSGCVYISTGLRNTKGPRF